MKNLNTTLVIVQQEELIIRIGGDMNLNTTLVIVQQLKKY